MERQFVYCHECDDLMEAEYRKGKWYCENCGKDVTQSIKRVKNNKLLEKKTKGSRHIINSKPIR